MIPSMRSLAASERISETTPIAAAGELTQSDQVGLHSRPVLRLNSEDGVTRLLD
jgi:hypothetical protein